MSFLCQSELHFDRVYIPNYRIPYFKRVCSSFNKIIGGQPLFRNTLRNKDSGMYQQSFMSFSKISNQDTIYHHWKITNMSNQAENLVMIKLSGSSELSLEKDRYALTNKRVFVDMIQKILLENINMQKKYFFQIDKHKRLHLRAILPYSLMNEVDLQVFLKDTTFQMKKKLTQQLEYINDYGLVKTHRAKQRKKIGGKQQQKWSIREQSTFKTEERKSQKDLLYKSILLHSVYAKKRKTIVQNFRSKGEKKFSPKFINSLSILEESNKIFFISEFDRIQKLRQIVCKTPHLNCQGFKRSTIQAECSEVQIQMNRVLQQFYKDERIDIADTYDYTFSESRCRLRNVYGIIISKKPTQFFQLQNRGAHSHLNIGEYWFQTMLTWHIYQSEGYQNSQLGKLTRSLLVRKSLLEGIQTSEDSFKNQMMFLNYMGNKPSQYLATYYRHPDIDYIEANEVFLDLYPRSLQQQCSNIRNEEIGLTVRAKFRYLIQIIKALVFMSDHSICHRDMKPNNIMIDQQSCVKVIDFGSSIGAFGTEQFQVFSQRLFPTQGYFQPYSILSSQVQAIYSRQQYYRHFLFDAYSLGKIIDDLFSEEIAAFRNNQLKKGYAHFSYIETAFYIGLHCSEEDPADRLTYQEMLYLVIETERSHQQISLLS